MRFIFKLLHVVVLNRYSLVPSTPLGIWDKIEDTVSVLKFHDLGEVSNRLE